MKTFSIMGVLVGFIFIYSWALVFSVVHHTQKRIDEAVAQEQTRCEQRMVALKARCSVQPLTPQLAQGTVQPAEAATQVSSPDVTAQEMAPTATAVASVAFEAQAASRAKYVAGLNSFNHDDYVTARQLWLESVQLDPTNVQAQLGLSKVEDLLKE